NYIQAAQLVSLSTGTMGLFGGTLPAISLSTGTMGLLNLGTQTTGVLASTALPTSVAYLNANQGWTAPQTYTSSITVTSANGEYVNFNLSAGSVTARNLTVIGPVQSDGNGNLVNALVSLSSGVIGNLSAGNLTGMIPGSQLADGSTSYFGQLQLVSLSTGTIGIATGSQIGGGSTNYIQAAQLVSLSSGVMGNLAAANLTGVLPGSHLAGGSTSYFQALQLVSLSTGTMGLFGGTLPAISLSTGTMGLLNLGPQPTGVLVSAALPTSVAYLNVNQGWTAPQ